MKQHRLTGILLLAMLVLMTTLCGCESREKYTETIHERIHENFLDIKSYIAKCTITVHSQKDHVYDVKMSYDKDNETFKMAYDDINIVLQSDSAKITKGGVSLKTRSSDSYMPMFVNSFFRYYYAGEESSINVSKVKNFGTTTLEAALSDNDSNASMQKIWIDNKTALPVKSEIYKTDGNIYMEIVFKSFEFK